MKQMNRLQQFHKTHKKEIKAKLAQKGKGGKFPQKIRDKIVKFTVDDYKSDGKKGFSPKEVSEETGIGVDLIYSWRYKELEPNGTAYGKAKKTTKKAKPKTFREMDEAELKKALKAKKGSAKLPKKVEKKIKERREENKVKEIISEKIHQTELIEELLKVAENTNDSSAESLLSYAAALLEKIDNYCNDKINETKFRF
jgi:hypothetical protein